MGFEAPTRLHSEAHPEHDAHPELDATTDDAICASARMATSARNAPQPAMAGGSMRLLPRARRHATSSIREERRAAGTLRRGKAPGFLTRSLREPSPSNDWHVRASCVLQLTTLSGRGACERRLKGKDASLLVPMCHRTSSRAHRRSETAMPGMTTRTPQGVGQLQGLVVLHVQSKQGVHRLPEGVQTRGSSRFEAHSRYLEHRLSTPMRKPMFDGGRMSVFPDEGGAHYAFNTLGYGHTTCDGFQKAIMPSASHCGKPVDRGCRIMFYTT